MVKQYRLPWLDGNSEIRYVNADTESELFAETSTPEGSRGYALDTKRSFFWDGVVWRVVSPVHVVGSIFIETAGINPSEVFGGVWTFFSEGRLIMAGDLPTPPVKM